MTHAAKSLPDEAIELGTEGEQILPARLRGALGWKEGEHDEAGGALVERALGDSAWRSAVGWAEMLITVVEVGVTPNRVNG